MRFYAEFEYDVSRVRMDDDYERRTEELPGAISLKTVTRSVVQHPRWSTFHIGLEVPLAGR